MAKVRYELDDDERALLVRMRSGILVTARSEPLVTELHRIGLVVNACGAAQPALYVISDRGRWLVTELEAADTNPGVEE